MPRKAIGREAPKFGLSPYSHPFYLQDSLTHHLAPRAFLQRAGTLLTQEEWLTTSYVPLSPRHLPGRPVPERRAVQGGAAAAGV